MATPKNTNFTVMDTNGNELDKEFKRMIIRIFDKVKQDTIKLLNELKQSINTQSSK